MTASEIAKEIYTSLRTCNEAPFGTRLLAYSQEERRLRQLGIPPKVTFDIRYTVLVPCTGSNASIEQAIFNLFTINQFLSQAVEHEFEEYCQSYNCTLATPNQSAKDMAPFTFINENKYILIIKKYF
ncbi:hypothetical protein [Vibrio atypicus]|uniref:hypothetical protein n=1 Tax=Vibrio atypicus TaxID=558271 RepID=UPI003735C2B1